VLVPSRVVAGGRRRVGPPHLRIGARMSARGCRRAKARGCGFVWSVSRTAAGIRSVPLCASAAMSERQLRLIARAPWAKSGACGAGGRPGCGAGSCRLPVHGGWAGSCRPTGRWLPRLCCPPAVPACSYCVLEWKRSRSVCSSSLVNVPGSGLHRRARRDCCVGHGAGGSIWAAARVPHARVRVTVSEGPVHGGGRAGCVVAARERGGPPVRPRASGT
jgi:hypothetical protein